MKSSYLIFTLLFVLFSQLLFIENSWAQEIILKATVNKNIIGLNETIEYKVEVSGGSTNLPTPNLPSFETLTILSGPNSSTSIQFINGQMSSSKSFSYYLQPQKVGEIKIPPATLEHNRKIISSNEITLTVKKSIDSNMQTNQPKSTMDTENIGNDLYLSASIDKQSVFQNEQILVSYKLYFRTNVRSYNIEKIPSNPGFWTEEFYIPSQPEIETEIVNGIAYQVATLRKLALFPTQSGELTIEPLVISVDALVKESRRTRSLFDSFFDDPFGRTVRRTLTTKPATIKVKPFPGNKPADFTGAVGKYSLALNTDKNQLKTNEAVSIKINLQGEGNIKLLKPPVLAPLPDMEIYDPKEKTSIKYENDKIKGSKIVEYIIVPRFAGEYTLQPVSLVYFDPESRRYINLDSNPVVLSVLPGDQPLATNLLGGNLSKQEVALLGEDLRFIKESANFYKAGVKIYNSAMYISLYFIPLIGLAFAWIYAKQREKIRSDLKLAKRRKAGRIAAKHLSAAKKALKPESQNDFYRKMTLALQGFVSDKLNIQMTEFNAITVQENLGRMGVGEQEIKEYKECLEEGDFRQFAGGSVSQEEMVSFFEKSKKVLTRLERYI